MVGPTGPGGNSMHPSPPQHPSALSGWFQNIPRPDRIYYIIHPTSYSASWYDAWTSLTDSSRCGEAATVLLSSQLTVFPELSPFIHYTHFKTIAEVQNLDGKLWALLLLTKLIILPRQTRVVLEQTNATLCCQETNLQSVSPSPVSSCTITCKKDTELLQLFCLRFGTFNV